MTRWARIWCVLWLAAAGLPAEPLFDEPVATLTLVDGTVLHDAQARGFMTKVVLVKCAEGLRTVAYDNFPEAYQAALAAKRQAAQAAVAKQAEEQKEQAALRPRSSPTADHPTKWETTPRCRFSVAGGRGAIVVVNIDNMTAFPAAIYPWQLMARTQTGKVLSGRHWVGLNTEGNVTGTLRDRQLIEGHGSATIALAVSPDPGDDLVEAVLWK